MNDPQSSSREHKNELSMNIFDLVVVKRIKKILWWKSFILLKENGTTLFVLRETLKHLRKKRENYRKVTRHSRRFSLLTLQEEILFPLDLFTRFLNKIQLFLPWPISCILSAVRNLLSCVQLHSINKNYFHCDSKWIISDGISQLVLGTKGVFE